MEEHRAALLGAFEARGKIRAQAGISLNKGKSTSRRLAPKPSPEDISETPNWPASTASHQELHRQVLAHLTQDEWAMFKGSLGTAQILPQRFRETWNGLLSNGFDKYEAEIAQDPNPDAWQMEMWGFLRAYRDKVMRGDLPSPAEAAAAKAEERARRMAERAAREWADKSILMPFAVPEPGGKPEEKKKKTKKNRVPKNKAETAGGSSATSNHPSNEDHAPSTQTAPPPNSALSPSYTALNRPDEAELLGGFCTAVGKAAELAAELTPGDALPEGDERAIKAFEARYYKYCDLLAEGEGAGGAMDSESFTPLLFFEFIELADERMISGLYNFDMVPGV